VIAVWALHARDKPPGPLRTFGAPVTALAMLASSYTREPALVSGLCLAALVAVWVASNRVRPARTSG